MSSPPADRDPGKRKRTAPNKSKATEPIDRRIDHAKEMIEAGGVELPGIGALMMVGRKFGWKGLLFILLFVGIPASEYSALRYAVYTALPRMAGNLGLDLNVAEWSLSPLTLRAVARNVALSDRTSKQPVLMAAEVEFQGSAWTLMRGLPDLLTFHVFGGQQPFNEIVIKHGELHLERSLTGRLNWTDFIAAVPRQRFDEILSGVYRVNELRLEDFRLTYVEHLPGGSGDGMIRTAQAHVKVDEIFGSLSDLAPPSEPGDRPTRFNLKGRSADGVLEVSGATALFLPEDREPADASARRVSLESDGEAAFPFEVSIYLENISAGAFGRMVPVGSIIPVKGVIAGRTTIVRAASAPQCQGSFTLTGVTFAPNPLVVTQPEDVEMVSRLLGNEAYTGPFEVCRGATPKDDAPRRPATAIYANFASQATVNASPGVKALVDRDRRVLGGEAVETTLRQLTRGLARDLGQRVAGALGGETGQAVSRSLAGGNATSDGRKDSGNPVVGGIKSVGSGIKRLFGGGAKKKNPN